MTSLEHLQDIADYHARIGQAGCWYCGERTLETQVEHIVPLSRNGSCDAKNLGWACRRCNMAKFTKTALEYKALLEERTGKPVVFAVEADPARFGLDAPPTLEGGARAGGIRPLRKRQRRRTKAELTAIKPERPTDGAARYLAV